MFWGVLGDRGRPGDARGFHVGDADPKAELDAGAALRLELPSEREPSLDAELAPAELVDSAAKLDGAAGEADALVSQLLAYEEKQLGRLEAYLASFQHDGSLKTAENMLRSEALLALHRRGEFEVLGTDVSIDQERPGFECVTHGSALGHRRYYVPLEEFAEYGAVLRLRRDNPSLREVEVSLKRAIVARVGEVVAKGTGVR